MRKVANTFINIALTHAYYGHRIHLYKDKDYKAFNKAGIGDKPIENICNIVRMLQDAETEIVVMTARDESCRRDTSKWLRINDVPYDRLIMRPLKNMSPDADCKRKSEGMITNLITRK